MTLRRLALAAIALLCLAGPARAEMELEFAVAPGFTTEQIYVDWKPLLDRLTKDTGIRFRLQTHASFADFEADLKQGGPDVAHLGPYLVMVGHRAKGYQPIVRDRGLLTAQLVVRRDSPVTSLKELEGAEIVFPDARVFTTLYLRAQLGKAGLSYTPKYVQRHPNVLRHVLTGGAPAGGTSLYGLATEDPRLREQLRVLYETPSIPNHPIVVHPRVSADLRQRLQHALTELARDPAARPLLEKIRMPQPVATDYSEYAPLEALGLDALTSP